MEHRRLYLVPQFFEHKPIERLIGPGITAADLNDDGLGRALDWLTTHDLTALYAGLAHQARRRFAVAAEAVHVDSTSFSVEGAYEREDLEGNETLIRITYGYSRDHRADLKQWQLSLATTTSGVPLGLQVLDGNASDQTTLAQQMAEVVYQFRAEREEEPIYVADSAGYSEARMTELDQKRVWGVGRVPETSTQAKALVAEEPVTWQGNEALALGGAGGRHWRADRALEHRAECRGGRTAPGHASLGERSRSASSGRSDCANSSSGPLPVRWMPKRPAARKGEGAPSFLEIALQVQVSTRHTGRGRPRTDTTPEQVWTVSGTVSIQEAALAAEARRKAKFIVATNVPAKRKSARSGAAALQRAERR